MKSNLVRALKKLPERLRDQEATRHNPYATEHAAQVLEANGQYQEAAEVRTLIDPSDDPVGSGDPLDFWLAVEEHELTEGN